MSIKGILGLNKKADETIPSTTTDESVDNTSAVGEGTRVDESTELYLLEAEVNAERREDPIGWAAEQLGEFRLTPGAEHLLDRALDNLANSTGIGIIDEAQREDILGRAQLIKATGNDLSIAIEAVVGSCGPLEAPGAVYSLLFNVLKAAVFIANLDLRRYLDPKQDNDLSMYMDKREEDRAPPYGYATRQEYEYAAMRELYGSEFQDFGDAPACALSDLRYFFQLTVEALGWNPDNTMPFSNVMNPDGTFAPINDPQQALDAAELRRQVSRAKKRERQATLNAAAVDKANELVRAALARRSKAATA